MPILNCYLQLRRRRGSGLWPLEKPGVEVPVTKGPRQGDKLGLDQQPRVTLRLQNYIFTCCAPTTAIHATAERSQARVTRMAYESFSCRSCQGRPRCQLHRDILHLSHSLHTLYGPSGVRLSCFSHQHYKLASRGSPQLSGGDFR